MHARPALGRRGEQLAADLFRKLGYAVLDTNYRCSEGEIDLVARRGAVVVFCEVKTRSTSRYGLPSEAVGQVKQARLRRCAARWLVEHGGGRSEVRFDVVAVVAAGRCWDVTHIADAF